MATTLPNPHYTPETFAKVTIINFGITFEGLVEQMLAVIVILENRQLEDQKNEIMKKNANDKMTLKNLEDDILKTLSESKGDILMDTSLIQKLSISKKTSGEIKIRVRDSLVTEKKIDAARENYRDLSFRSAILFFTIVDLSNIDPMYQYSLQWFENIFKMSIENIPNVKENIELGERLEVLTANFTYQLYKNVCTSLFEKDKILFSFLMSCRIFLAEKKMDRAQFNALMVQPQYTGEIPENPSKLIPDNTWPNVFK